MPELAAPSPAVRMAPILLTTLLAPSCTPSPSTTTLRVALWAGGHELEIEQQVADRYEDLHPGVRVLLESAPNGYEERTPHIDRGRASPRRLPARLARCPHLRRPRTRDGSGPIPGRAGLRRRQRLPAGARRLPARARHLRAAEGLHADGDLREPRGAGGGGGRDADARGMDVGRLPRGGRSGHEGHRWRRTPRCLRLRLPAQPVPVGAVRVVGRGGHSRAGGRLGDRVHERSRSALRLRLPDRPGRGRTHPRCAVRAAGRPGARGPFRLGRPGLPALGALDAARLPRPGCRRHPRPRDSADPAPPIP